MLKRNFSLITESNFPRVGDTLYSDGGFPDRSDGKESACNVGDPDLIPGSERSLEKGMTTTPAWEKPWTEEPGGLQSMGLQRIEHN